jgi:FKBP-type peptidyl-prolyl cis-trans isomerase FkpA
MIRSIIALALLSSTPLFAADDLTEEKRLSSEYLLKMAAEAGARTLDQGVVLRPLFESNSGTYPDASSTVQVSYLLTDREGRTIEESLSSDQVVEFPLAKLISCWKIALPQIAIGSFYKISCPSDTAYGDQGAGGVIKPGAALTFRVNLYGIRP